MKLTVVYANSVRVVCSNKGDIAVRAVTELGFTVLGILDVETVKTLHTLRHVHCRLLHVFVMRTQTTREEQRVSRLQPVQGRIS